MYDRQKNGYHNLLSIAQSPVQPEAAAGGSRPDGKRERAAGFADQRNIELLAGGGFSVPEAIRIATLNGATFLNLQEKIGSIGKGKRADLAVIEGDPSTQIADIEKVRLVFKDGTCYDSSKLLESVRGMVGFINAGLTNLSREWHRGKLSAESQHIMTLKLKPLNEQTIVITGASSGIGLVTARMAVAKGARVVLAARQESALATLAAELNAQGERAAYIAADVKRPEEVRKIAQLAIDKFGGFDTWVNDAGTSVYGLVREVPVEDEQEVFAVNFWGSVCGMRTAVEHLRTKGGAIVNVGSEASDHAIPLQASYSASKHALKAYTDALRVELKHENVPISVTLVKPTGIATPFFEHAKNYMQEAPKAPAPMYAPELVAEAILYAAETPTRDFLVGESAVLNSAMGRLAPKINDRVMQVAGFKGQKSGRTAKTGENQGLRHASGTLKERGDYDVTVLESSAYSKAKMHPVLATAIAVATSAAVTAAVVARRSR